jgi:hypothetical protein
MDEGETDIDKRAEAYHSILFTQETWIIVLLQYPLSPALRLKA